MEIPILHSNGTSKERLLEGYLTAYEALDNAERALLEASPNGRDYYPQPGSYPKASDEHTNRLQRLAAIRKEIEEIIQAIDAQ